MLRHSPRFGLTFVFLIAVATPKADAAFIVAGQTVIPSVAIQDITLLPGTLFNPTDSAIVLKDFSGRGFLTLNRETQSGDTIVISSLSGLYYGSHPILGDYVFGSIAPLPPADFSATITSVVQNPLDPGFATGQPSSFQSGNLTFGGKSFGLELLSGPGAGIQLFTDPSVPFSFSGTLDGLPPSPGTVFTNSGTDRLNILFNGQVVAESSNRRIVATPEPSSLTLLGMGLVSLGCYSRRRRKLA